MKIKRIAYLILSISLLLSQFCVIAAENEKNYRQEAIDFVMDFQIVDSAEHPDTEITRSEFAKVLCRMINLQEGVGQTVGLKDVAADDESMPYIAAMIDMGVFTVDGTHRFYPMRSVSEAEALDAFVALLGYEELLPKTKSHKDSVRILANRLNWLNGMECEGHNHNANHKLTRGDVIELCFNVLSSEYYYETIASGKKSYTYRERHTVAAEFFNLTAETGRVVQTYKSGLMTSEGCQEGWVRIDDTLYKAGDTKAAEYLGYQVEFWYNKDNTLIYVYPDKSCKTLSISADSIDECTRDSIRYYNSGNKLTTVRFPEADVLYNGVALYEYEEEDFRIENGTIELLDYNGDGVYDTVFINTYIPMVIYSIDVQNRKVVDYLTQTAVSLDTSDFDILELFRYDAETKTCTEAKFEDIAPDDILMMYQSKEGEKAKVVLYTNAITGEVTKTVSDDEDIWIDGAKYTVSAHLQQAIANDIPNVSKPEAGKAGIFFVDIYGEVVWSELQDKVNLYGYASNFKVTKEAFDEIAQIRVYTISNKWESYELADKVEFNGATVSDYSQIKAALLPGGKFVPQIVRYSINSENLVTELDVYVDRSGDSTYIGDDQECFTRDAVITAGRFKTTTMAFGKRYLGSTGRTYVFNVPTGSVTNDGKVDEDKIYCYSMSVFQNDCNYTVEIYDADEFHVAKAILWNGEASEVYENNLFFINYIAKTMGADGELLYELDGYLGNSPTSIFCVDESVAAGLKNGDICKVALLPDGRAQNLKRVFTLNADAAGSADVLTRERIGERNFDTTSALQTSAYAVYFADVYAVNTGGTNLLAYTSGGALETFYTGGVEALKYNYTTERYEPATIHEIVGKKYDSENTKLFIHERFSTTLNMVIFNPEVK